MSKKLNIEAEGGELILKNKAGDYVIIPKSYRKEVEGMIDDGCYGCIDNLVETLPESSDYAEDGSLIPSDPKKVKTVKIDVNGQVKTLRTDSKEYNQLYKSGKLMGYSKGRDTYAAPELPEITVTGTADEYVVFENEYAKRNKVRKTDKGFEERVGKEFTKYVVERPEKLVYDNREHELFEKYATSEDKKLYEFYEAERTFNDKSVLEVLTDVDYWSDIARGTATDQTQFLGEWLYKSKKYRDLLGKNPALKRKIDRLLAFNRKYPLVLYYKMADAAFGQGRPFTALSQVVKLPEIPIINDFLMNVTQSNQGDIDIKTVEDKEIPYFRLKASVNNNIANTWMHQRNMPKSDSYMMWTPREYGQQFVEQFPGTTHNDFVNFIEAYAVGRKKSQKETVDAYMRFRKAVEKEY